MSFTSKRESIKKIAKKRALKLLKMARETYDKDPKLSKRYVELARKIAMKHRIHLPAAFCRKCNTIFIPGKTLKIRISSKQILYICLVCNYTRRKVIT